MLHIFWDLANPKSDRLGDRLEIHTPTELKKVYYKRGGKVDSVKVIIGMFLGSMVFCEITLLHPYMVEEYFRRTFTAKMRYYLIELNPQDMNQAIEKV